MNCIKCGSDTKVINSNTTDSTYRIRRCKECETQFITRETITDTFPARKGGGRKTKVRPKHIRKIVKNIKIEEPEISQTVMPSIYQREGLTDAQIEHRERRQRLRAFLNNENEDYD